jgi:hypothetical protein
MRAAIAVAALWTVVVLVIVVMTPSLVSSPPCSHMVDPQPGCATLTEAANDLVWLTQTRPIVVLSIGGYAVIAILALATRRRR